RSRGRRARARSVSTAAGPAAVVTACGARAPGATSPGTAYGAIAREASTGGASAQQLIDDIPPRVRTRSGSPGVFSALAGHPVSVVDTTRERVGVAARPVPGSSRWSGAGVPFGYAGPVPWEPDRRAERASCRPPALDADNAAVRRTLHAARRRHRRRDHRTAHRTGVETPRSPGRYPFHRRR